MPRSRSVKSEEKSYLTTGQAGQELGFTSEAIRQWITAGKIKAFRVQARGEWRIPKEEVERIKRGIKGDVKET